MKEKPRREGCGRLSCGERPPTSALMLGGKLKGHASHPQVPLLIVLPCLCAFLQGCSAVSFLGRSLKSLSPVNRTQTFLSLQVLSTFSQVEYSSKLLLRRPWSKSASFCKVISRHCPLSSRCSRQCGGSSSLRNSTDSPIRGCSLCLTFSWSHPHLADPFYSSESQLPCPVP